jgi:hypothetical protein
MTSFTEVQLNYTLTARFGCSSSSHTEGKAPAASDRCIDFCVVHQKRAIVAAVRRDPPITKNFFLFSKKELLRLPPFATLSLK